MSLVFLTATVVVLALVILELVSWTRQVARENRQLLRRSHSPTVFEHVDASLSAGEKVSS